MLWYTAGKKPLMSCCARHTEKKQDLALTLLGPQSRFGDKLLRIWLVCPKNETAVLKGLKVWNGYVETTRIITEPTYAYHYVSHPPRCSVTFGPGHWLLHTDRKTDETTVSEKQNAKHYVHAGQTTAVQRGSTHFKPSRTAVPFWGQPPWNSSSLSPKKADCGSKRVESMAAVSLN